MSSLDETRRHLEGLLAERRARLQRARAVERHVVTLAMVAFVTGAVLVLLSFDRLFGLVWWWTLPGAGLVVVLLVAWREAATRRRRRAGFSVDWLVRALARLDDRWGFGQEDGSSYVDPEHPYTQDLDVFGEGSLFQRMNACHTALGRDRLAAVLSGKSGAEQVLDNQQAVRELLEDPGLREELEVELRTLAEIPEGGPEEQGKLDAETRGLLGWGETPTPPPESPVRVLLQAFLGVAATAVVVAVPVLGLEWGLIIPFYLVNFVVLGRARDLDELLTRFERVRSVLGAWARVIDVAGRKPAGSAPLRAAQELMQSGPAPAPQAIRRLQRLAGRLAYRRNVFWAMTLDVLWLWDLHVRRGLLRWKRRYGGHLGGWLEGAARFEAAAALAAYAEAVPDQTWPGAPGRGPAFEARGLVHPLLPRDGRVGNDLVMEEPGSVLLVTGSNMSGKSTFLRACGLAVVMARAGVPVAAEAFGFREDLRVVTSMRVQDSLRSGSSRFHAEVLRLRRCLDWAAEGGACLVLLDEILAGTNSRERHVGTRAVLASLARLPTLTLVATHDLALAELKEEIGDGCRMVHFRDLVRDGRMSFDYLLRPGPLPSTNALRLMRDAGLDVGPE